MPCGWSKEIWCEQQWRSNVYHGCGGCWNSDTGATSSWHVEGNTLLFTDELKFLFSVFGYMQRTENLRFAAVLLMMLCLPFSPDGILLDVTHLACREPETNISRVMLYYKYLSQKPLKICKHYSCWLGRDLPCKKEKENRFSLLLTHSAVSYMLV